MEKKSNVFSDNRCRKECVLKSDSRVFVELRLALGKPKQDGVRVYMREECKPNIRSEPEEGGPPQEPRGALFCVSCPVRPRLRCHWNRVRRDRFCVLPNVGVFHATVLAQQTLGPV